MNSCVHSKYPSNALDWDYLKSKNSRYFRAGATRRFNRTFPKGHKTSIRSKVSFIVKQMQEQEQFQEGSILSEMNDFHPEALALLVTYGTDYIPVVWGRRPPEPYPRACCKNSWILSLGDFPDRKFFYVEGIVISSIILPMLHAWNTVALDSNEAIDWTLYSHCQWSRYLGIPFTLDEHRQLRKVTPLGDHGGLLFHRKYFTKEAKEKLMVILEKRKTSS